MPKFGETPQTNKNVPGTVNVAGKPMRVPRYGIQDPETRSAQGRAARAARKMAVSNSSQQPPESSKYKIAPKLASENQISPEILSDPGLEGELFDKDELEPKPKPKPQPPVEKWPWEKG